MGSPQSQVWLGRDCHINDLAAAQEFLGISGNILKPTEELVQHLVKVTTWMHHIGHSALPVVMGALCAAQTGTWYLDLEGRVGQCRRMLPGVLADIEQLIAPSTHRPAVPPSSGVFTTLRNAQLAAGSGTYAPGCFAPISSRHDERFRFSGLMPAAAGAIGAAAVGIPHMEARHHGAAAAASGGHAADEGPSAVAVGAAAAGSCHAGGAAANAAASAPGTAGGAGAPGWAGGTVAGYAAGATAAGDAGCAGGTAAAGRAGGAAVAAAAVYAADAAGGGRAASQPVGDQAAAASRLRGESVSTSSQAATTATQQSLQRRPAPRQPKPPGELVGLIQGLEAAMIKTAEYQQATVAHKRRKSEQLLASAHQINNAETVRKNQEYLAGLDAEAQVLRHPPMLAVFYVDPYGHCKAFRSAALQPSQPGAELFSEAFGLTGRALGLAARAVRAAASSSQLAVDMADVRSRVGAVDPAASSGRMEELVAAEQPPSDPYANMPYSKGIKKVGRWPQQLWHPAACQP